MAPRALKPYFLLPEPATADKIPALLGRCVPFSSSNPNDPGNPLKRPTEGYIYPELPPDGPDLRTFDTQLYPKGEIKAREAHVLQAFASGREAKLAVENALKVFHSSTKTDTRESSIPGFRRITMDEAPKHVRKLLQQPQYSSPIFEYFSKVPDGKLAVCTSIICAMDMSLSVGHGQEHETGGQAQPIPGSLNLPASIADIGARASKSAKNAAEVEGTYVGEVVVACGYIEMTRKPVSSFFGMFRPKPSIDDIVITDDYLQPRTMTIALPTTRIEGDQPAILGGMGDSERSSMERTAQISPDDPDSDMILFD